jgi:SAM-dependent methyltransferase
VRNARGRSIYEDGEIFLSEGNDGYYLDPARGVAAEAKVDWLRRWLPVGARLLDLGAGFGHFLAACEGVFEAHGVEISPTAVAWSRTHLHVDNQVGDAAAVPADRRGPWDALTLWDVIEHVDDPRATLRAAAALVPPGGHLFLSTPDAGSRVARWMGRSWHYHDPVQHVFLFTRQNLSRILGDAGFSLIGWGTAGQVYRLRYVLERLAALYPGPVARLTGGLVRRLPLADRVSIPIELGDVMTLACVRRP